MATDFSGTGTPAVVVVVSRRVFTDSELDAILYDCMRKFDPAITVPAMATDVEMICIRKLAHAEICDLFMSDNAKYYPLSLDGLSADKGVRVERWERVKNKLLEEVKDLKTEYGLGGVNVRWGMQTREARVDGKTIPYEGHVRIPPPRLRVVSSTSTSVKLGWFQVISPIFVAYRVWQSGDGGVTWENVATIYNSATLEHEVDGLTAGAVYQFKVGVYDKNAEESFSNIVTK